VRFGLCLRRLSGLRLLSGLRSLSRRRLSGRRLIHVIRRPQVRLPGDRLFGLGYHRHPYVVDLFGSRRRDSLAICRLFDLSTRV
jgi:hypothetical protein